MLARSSRRRSPLIWALALGALLGPILAFFVLANPLQKELAWPGLATGAGILSFGHRVALTSADQGAFVARLYLYGIAAMGLRLAGLVVLLVAAWILFRSAGRSATIVVVFAGLAVGVAFTEMELAGVNQARLCLVNDVLSRAEKAAVVPAGTLRRLTSVLHVNNLFAFSALWILLPAFALVARPRAVDLPSGPEVLRTELWHLRILIGLGSMVLVPAVAATFGFLLVTLPILEPSAAPGAAQLATAVSTFLGGVLTLLLLIPSVCSLASIGLQALRLAERASPDSTFGGCVRWLKENDLHLSPAHLASTLAGTLGPLLATPALDLAGSLFRFAPAN